MASALLGVSLLSGCSYTDPCRSLPPPSVAQLQAAEEGAEIEVDVAGGECELVNGAWYFEQDSSHRSGSHSTYRTPTLVAPGQPSRTVPKTSTAAPKPTTPKKSLAPQKPSQTAKK